MAVEKAEIVTIMVDGYPGSGGRDGCDYLGKGACQKECYALGTMSAQANYDGIDSDRLIDAAENYLAVVDPQNSPPCLDTLLKIAQLREK